MPTDLEDPAQLAKHVEDAVGVLPAGQLVVPILTPTLGTVSMFWHVHQLALQYPMNIGRQPITVFDRHGGEVAEMRNRLVAMSLAIEEKSQGRTRVPSVFWIDDDVLVDPMAFGCLAEHFRDPAVKIVSGVYFSKAEFGSEPLIFPGPSAGTMEFKPNEVFEAWGWAQGLSIVSTEVYRRMRDEMDIGLDKYGLPNWYKNPAFQVTQDGFINGGTEDFHFFDKANKLGYRAIVDCRRSAFGFHYDLRAKVAYPLKQWEQASRQEKIIWPGTSVRKEVVW